jgi:hypothetical protein
LHITYMRPAEETGVEEARGTPQPLLHITYMRPAEEKIVDAASLTSLGVGGDPTTNIAGKTPCNHVPPARARNTPAAAGKANARHDVVRRKINNPMLHNRKAAK